jgi:hypothetical protein
VSAIEGLADITFIVPEDPIENATLSVKRLWEKRCDEFVTQDAAYKNNI